MDGMEDMSRRLAARKRIERADELLTDKRRMYGRADELWRFGRFSFVSCDLPRSLCFAPHTTHRSFSLDQPNKHAMASTTEVVAAEQAPVDLKSLSSSLSPEAIEPLEQAVDRQAAAQAAYSLETNLALLRLYNFYPAHYKSIAVVKILCLSLMQLPENHFVLALSAVSPVRVCRWR